MREGVWPSELGIECQMDWGGSDHKQEKTAISTGQWGPSGGRYPITKERAGNKSLWCRKLLSCLFQIPTSKSLTTLYSCSNYLSPKVLKALWRRYFTDPGGEAVLTGVGRWRGISACPLQMRKLRHKKPHHMQGRLTNAPKDVHIPISGPHLCSKMDFAEVMKWWVLKWEDDPGWSGWPQCDHRGPYRRGQSQGRRKGWGQWK